MRYRLLSATLLLPLAALAQLQLMLVEQGVERPSGAYLQVGSTPVGDPLDVSFRIRNVGAFPASLQTLSVSGVAFTLLNKPSLPFQVPAGSAVNFAVRFQPAAYGSYSASLSFNNSVTILAGNTVVAATVELAEGGDWKVLSSGAFIDFGRVERGARSTRRLRLENLTTSSLTVSGISVEGRAFRGPAGIAAPLTLEARAWAEFNITFEPDAAQVFDGVLRVDSRTFSLQGTGAEPPLPRPIIELSTASPASSQQVPLAIRFAGASSTSGSGELRVELQPASPGAVDPAVLFPSSNSRFVTFTVKEGENFARFNGQPSVLVQTGTTAGTLVFTARLGGYTETVAASVLPAVVGLDWVRGLRNGSNLEVQITGYDNTRSASKLGFTFYDKSSRAVQPGQIVVNAADIFRTYFDASQKEAGGVFLLRAVFPISGDVSGISSVDVELTNAAGVARAARIEFP